MTIRGRILAGLALALLAACGGPRVAPITVRYVSAPPGTSVIPETVEVVRGPEVRPYETIAFLEVEPDGSSFESLALRLRDRAAQLGADAIVDVTAVYDVPVGDGPSITTNADTEERTRNTAAKAGWALLFARPAWISVRATAVRFTESLASGAEAATRPTPSLESPRTILAPASRPSPPESAPQEKP